jgi:hypothetical protein
MSVAFGSGLIAAGALLALGTVLFPPADKTQVGSAEGYRQERNANIATACAAVAGFVGAVLVLVGTEWMYAFLGAAALAAAYYVFLATVTYFRQRRILSTVLLEREIDHDEAGAPGRITVATAADLGIGSGGDGGLRSHFLGAAQDPQSRQDAALYEALARNRARLTWALRYPYGRERRAPVVRLIAWRQAQYARRDPNP